MQAVRNATLLRSSQSASIFESTTVNETCFCRARPLGVPLAGSCILSITAKRRAGVVAPYGFCCFSAMTGEESPRAQGKRKYLPNFFAPLPPPRAGEALQILPFFPLDKPSFSVYHNNNSYYHLFFRQ